MQKELRRYLIEELVTKRKLIKEIYLPFVPPADVETPYLVIQQKKDNLVNNATFDINDFTIFIQINENESYSKLHEIQEEIYNVLHLKTFGNEKKYTANYRGNTFGENLDSNLRVKYTGINYQVVALKAKNESNSYEKAVAFFVQENTEIKTYLNHWTSGFEVPSILIRSAKVEEEIIAFDTQKTTHQIIIHVVSDKEKEIQKVTNEIVRLINMNQIIPFENGYLFLDSKITKDFNKDMITEGQIDFKVSKDERIFKLGGKVVTKEEYLKNKQVIRKLKGRVILK